MYAHTPSSCLCPGSQSPTVPGFLPPPHLFCRSLLPPCILPIQAVWDSSPFPVHHHQIVAPLVHSVTTQANNSGTFGSCLILVPGLCRLGCRLFLSPFFAPRTLSFLLGFQSGRCCPLLTYTLWLLIACPIKSKLLCLLGKALHICLTASSLLFSISLHALQQPHRCCDIP